MLGRGANETPETSSFSSSSSSGAEWVAAEVVVGGSLDEGGWSLEGRRWAYSWLSVAQQVARVDARVQ